MAQHFGLRRFEPRSPREATLASDALLAAAERDAGEIVATARGEVQRTILKAQQELLALNAQVRTTIERLEERAGGRREGQPPAASRVLRDAHAQLEALSIEPRPTAVVVAHPSVQLPPAPPAALSPYEMDNARVRVRVPARAARGLRVAPTAAIVLAGSLFVGALGWTRGWLPLPRSTEPRPASDVVQPDDAPGEPSSEATGMIGRNGRNVRSDRAARNALAPRTPATSTGSVAPPGVVAAPVNTSPAARQELLTSAERWLDAYYRQDAGKMATLSTAAVTLTDERTPEERLPSGLSGVRRTLGDATVQVFGSDAILTAKITERSDAGGRESASFISQMWTRRAGTWQVTDVRIVSAAAVARAFKR